MSRYMLLWSIRGRVIVEADDDEQAKEKFYQGLENSDQYLQDSDGYEVDEVQAIDEEVA